MIFAPVEEVRVYRNSAVVRRKASVRLCAGDNVVLICGLSSTADPDSLRLFFPAGVVGKDMRILSYQEAQPRLPSAEAAEELAETQNRIQTLKTVEDLWIANGNFASRGECSAETVTEYLDALPAHLEKLRAQKKELSRRLEELEEKKNELSGREAFRVVRLALSVPADCDAAFEMEYADNSADWAGTYEIRTSSDSDEISVVSRARIRQYTGEDWENVRVTLYTGSPSARQEIPELQKLSLDFRPAAGPAPYGRSMPGAGAALSPMMDTMICEDAAPMRMEMEESEETDADTMTGYVLPGLRTVISGADGTMADLKTVGVSAQKRIVCVPKLDDSAYLAAMIRTADWPLGPSTAKMYLNENYCGEVRVAPDPAEEIFMLSFGRDERIGVSREEIRSKTEDVLLKGQKRRSSEYLIRIVNKQDKPHTVLVWDQIPVPAEKQIVVDRVSVDGASVDETTGKLNWNLTVPGKAAVEKRLSYTVTYPKDKQLRETRVSAKGGLKICPRCGSFVQGKFCPVCGSPAE